MSDQISEIKALAEVQGSLLEKHRELKSFMEKASGELEVAKTVSVETKSALEKLADQNAELSDKCLEIERRVTEGFNGAQKAAQESIGQMFVKSDAFKAIAEGRSKFARMEIKAAIVNATGQNQPLVPADRLVGIINNPNRILTIRDALPVGRTTSNLIEFTKENVYTNNAGPQYDSPAFENVTKPESGITFTLESAPVVTLAHFIPLSRQVLEDSAQIESYVNGRLSFGLKLEEEDQLLNGNGTSGNIGGILKSGNFTAYNRAVTGDTKLDTLRRAITQAQLSEFMADTIVLNPADWEEIELLKATDNQYVWSNPVAMAGPQIWGKAVIPTNSIASGTFLVGAMAMGAQVWDRQDANVQISYEDGDNFKKNMATLRAEERLALTVYRPAAFVSGSF
jgi:HK97 family phage major capsid protein